jgi:hypothetical protein
MATLDEISKEKQRVREALARVDAQPIEIGSPGASRQYKFVAEANTDQGRSAMRVMIKFAFPDDADNSFFNP